ncbi:hypothetical protein CCYA_CCYA08G2436 [Cyanidiococcus yangmingshanensis]|nr:hypothetical protein CCYA_CCYA08G2436 [Cyanidiococcus yangmingshanensis]
MVGCFRPESRDPCGGFVGVGPVPTWSLLGACRRWRPARQRVTKFSLRRFQVTQGKRRGSGACFRGIRALAATDPVEGECVQPRWSVSFEDPPSVTSEHELRSSAPNHSEHSGRAKNADERLNAREQHDILEGKAPGVRLFLHRTRRAAPTSAAGVAAMRAGSRSRSGITRDAGRLNQRSIGRRMTEERVPVDNHGLTFIQVSSQVTRALRANESRQIDGRLASSTRRQSSAEEVALFLDEIELRCAYLGPIGASLVRIALERSLKHPRAAPHAASQPAKSTTQTPTSSLVQNSFVEAASSTPQATFTKPHSPETCLRSMPLEGGMSTDRGAVRTEASNVVQSEFGCLWRLRAILSTVIDLQMDLEAVLAAALRDAYLPSREIAREFGGSVADILAQERAIRQIVHATSMDSNPAGLRQLLIGVARDWRAIALFFAEVLFELRLHSEMLGLIDESGHGALNQAESEDSARMVPDPSNKPDMNVVNNEAESDTDHLTWRAPQLQQPDTVAYASAAQRLDGFQCAAPASDLVQSGTHVVPREPGEHLATTASLRDGANAAARAAAHRIAILTLEVLAPLANQLGIYYLQCEMEELAFLLLFPVQGEALRQQVAMRFEACADILEQARQAIANALSREPQVHSHVRSWTIRGRVKSLYSTYRKMIRLGSGIDDVLDLLALRVVLRPVDPSTELEACDIAMAAIERLWPSIQDRRRDFIRSPKENGYQSLHTTILVDDWPVEVQVRSERMHRLAEYGRAAHWLYKQNTGVLSDSMLATHASIGTSTNEVGIRDTSPYAAAITEAPCAPSVGEFEFESHSLDCRDCVAQSEGLISTPTVDKEPSLPAANKASSMPSPNTGPSEAGVVAAVASGHSIATRDEVVLDDTVTASLGTHTEYFRVLYHQIVELERSIIVVDVDSGRLLRLPRGTKLGEVGSARIINGRAASADTLLRTGDQIGGMLSSSL